MGRLGEALGLWRGPALVDFAYESFAQAEASRLEELRVGALEDRFEAALALGRHSDLISDLEATARQYPLRERLWAHWMLALYRCGRQADALRAYQGLRTHLAEELGITPSPELVALEEAIVLQKPELDWVAPTRPATGASIEAAARVRDWQRITTTHYAKSDGVDIAFQALGVDSPDLLMFSSAVLPIDSMDEDPSLARFIDRLASFNRVLRFDMRGVGMSDPVSPSSPPTLEQWVHDAAAVLDAAGSERAAVFAPRDSSLHAILLATTCPDRVSSLVMVNGTARMARADDYPFGIPQRVLDRFLQINMEIGCRRAGIRLFSPRRPECCQRRLVSRLVEPSRPAGCEPRDLAGGPGRLPPGGRPVAAPAGPGADAHPAPARRRQPSGGSRPVPRGAHPRGQVRRAARSGRPVLGG